MSGNRTSSTARSSSGPANSASGAVKRVNPAKTWGVVVPSNREEKLFEFLSQWRPLFNQYDVNLYIIWDGLEKPLPEAYDWRDIRSWCIPQRTDMVRSWGIYLSWLDGNQYTLTLDDDVTPYTDIFREYGRVFEAGAPFSRYVDVGAFTSFDGHLRGFPFRDRKPAKVAVQYGGWHGILDYDAPTQLALNIENQRFKNIVFPVPNGALATTCIMNAAWRTEYAPIMWQLPLVNGKYNRFGDIWSGVFQKRALDFVGDVMVVNGAAVVEHNRASDPLANLEREQPGIKINEDIQFVLPHSASHGLLSAYRSVTDRASELFDSEYSIRFVAARDEWLRLFK